MISFAVPYYLFVTITLIPLGQCSVQMFATITGGNTSNAPVYTYQWYLDGNPLLHQTDPFITTSLNGNYTLVVTDGVCSGTSNVITISGFLDVTLNVTYDYSSDPPTAIITPTVGGGFILESWRWTSTNGGEFEDSLSPDTEIDSQSGSVFPVPAITVFSNDIYNLAITYQFEEDSQSDSQSQSQSNFCVQYVSAFVTIYPLTLQVTSMPVGLDTKLTVLIEGGVAPFTIQWGNGPTTESIIVTGNNFYGVEVTDTMGVTAFILI